MFGGEDGGVDGAERDAGAGIVAAVAGDGDALRQTMDDGAWPAGSATVVVDAAAAVVAGAGAAATAVAAGGADDDDATEMVHPTNDDALAVYHHLHLHRSHSPHRLSANS